MTIRTAAAALLAAVALSATAAADDKFKLPPLDDKGWKEVPGKNGLKAWDVKEGKGAEVKPGATVKVHYTGWLKDGTVFDSSYKRNEPIEFPLDGVIKGWTDGVPGMKPGGVRRLYIPYAQAYGERGRPPVIPAKADLIFEIELLESR
jgi:FKBP-type peptidyl-prolyl cis-trans isomerase